MTTTEERARQKTTAIDLHLASVPMKKIAEHVGVSITVARRLVKEALADRVGETELSETVQTEIARIDAMISGIWATARRGDVNAVDRVLKLQERREKLMIPRANTHALREAYDRTVESSRELKGGVDDALVELGRKTVDQIDHVVATGTSYELTKALYLQPHIMNALREMLATPASRAAADRGDEDNVGVKLNHLRAVAKQGQRGA